MPFTHLEVHSHFSLLAGTASPAELAARAAADGLSRLALTDTAALYGAVAFSRACTAAHVQPIIGMTVPVLAAASPPLPILGRARSQPRPGAAAAPRAPAPRELARLVLLAKNPDGYRSLCRLASLLQSAGAGQEAQFRPALSWTDLRAHRAGLFCLSAGEAGWIERYLHAGDLSAAQVYAARLAGIFGEDACLSIHLPGPASDTSGLALEVAVAREVAAMGKRLGLRVAAVQPVHCLAPGDAPRLRLLAAIRCNCRLSDVPPHELPPAGDRSAAEWHWLAPSAVEQRFAEFPGALATTGEVAAACGLVLPGGKLIWPAVPLAPGQTPDQALAELAHAGLAAKYGPSAPGSGHPAAGRPEPAVAQRLERELTAIAGHGYAPLFLVVADIVRFARATGVPVSTRGSVANSLAAYCAGITDVDPVAHGLLFERFLSPARHDPPDIDLDLCSRRRDEVLAYVRKAYGADRMALVGTVSTLRLASAVRAAAKAHGLPEEEIGRLAARVPRGRWRPRLAELLAAPAGSPADAGEEPVDGAPDAEYAAEPGDAPPDEAASRAELSGSGPEVAALLAEIDDPAWQAVLRDALAIVGQPDHMGVHPGGVVITPGPLTDFVPVQWAPKGFLTTQYEHDDVAALGLPKIDLLGVRALTVLADAADLVRRRDPSFRLESIPSADRPTAALLARGDTIGVFQCESDGARATLRKLRAHNQADLAIANAFFKPGPSTGGMAAHFVKRYRGEEQPSYLHPALIPILSPTKGVLIFQEQVLRIATEVAGLHWSEADGLRRGMSHMEPAAMADLRSRFVAGCQRPAPGGPALSAEQAATLWDQVAAFAGYGFNQGHALAYAAVSYRSAYLRAHWPAEFLCARLADAGGFHHPVIYLAEALRLGFAVCAPHVNHSDRAFTLQREPPATPADDEAGKGRGPAAIAPTLWMGLGQVRDLRQAAIESIVRERARAPFASLPDLVARVDLQAKELRNLIQCGALDGLGASADVPFQSRAALLAVAETQPRASKARAAGVMQLAFTFDEPGAPAESAAQRAAWESAVLGLPLTALRDPLSLLPLSEAGGAPVVPEHVSLEVLLGSANPAVASRQPVIGLRLPGWTGGPGFFLWDGHTLVTARQPRVAKAPAPWQLLLVRGHRRGDDWGSFWLEVDELQPLA